MIETCLTSVYNAMIDAEQCRSQS